MKKVVIALLFFVSVASQAQTNLQVHYDLGKGRDYVTTTLEMFKPDKWGNTFFFVDVDYNGGTKNHPSLAYMEIARCLKFWDAPFSAHVEYNGGLFGLGSSYLPINNAWLAGVDYGWHDKSFTKFLNLKLLYKTIQDKNDASFQITGVWTLNFFKNKLTLSGFADFWREDNVNFTNAQGDPITPTSTKFVFISEPQFWYNVTPNLSLGSEIEVASNFGSVNGLKVCPTLAAKWNF
ncbi:MAG: hypothetical protein H6Q20_1730 [Bacteroidetes bacterium]|jgi:hypothetical protein|nr:hypothetical protein [Bacteroidota bacterium]